MTNEEFKEACKMRGWKYKDAAESLGRSLGMVKLYATTGKIPEDIAEVLATEKKPEDTSKSKPCKTECSNSALMQAKVDVLTAQVNRMTVDSEKAFDRGYQECHAEMSTDAVERFRPLFEKIVFDHRLGDLGWDEYPELVKLKEDLLANQDG